MALQSQTDKKKSNLVIKIAIFSIIWVIAVALGFFTRKNSSITEPFIVGSGVTLIVFFALGLMKTYDKVFDNIERHIK